MTPPVFLRSRQVMRMFGISRSTLYRWTQNAEMGFPAPVPFGSEQTLLWIEAELVSWARRQVRAARPSFMDFESPVTPSADEQVRPIEDRGPFPVRAERSHRVHSLHRSP
jgi:predicted DNA-binding transcriptional regulator AlpA